MVKKYSPYYISLIRFFSLGVNFLFNSYIAKELGATISGDFFYAFSIVNIIAVFSRFGLDTYSLRERARVANTTVLFPSIAMVVITGTLVVSLVYFFSYLGYEVAEKIKILVFSGIFINITTISTQLLLASSKPMLGTTLSTLITTSLCFVLIMGFDSNLNNLIVCYVISSFFTAVTCLLFVRHEVIIDTRLSINAIKSLILGAKSFYQASIISSLVVFVPIFFIANFSSGEQVAWYTLSTRISSACAVFMVAMNTLYSPPIANSYIQGDYKKFKTLCRKAFYSLSKTMIPTIIVCGVFSEYYFSYLGEDFRGGYRVLIILLCAQLVNSVFGFSGTILNMIGHERRQRNNVFICCFIIVSTSFFTVSFFGATGAAISFFIGNSIGNIKSYLDFRRLCESV